MPWWARGPGISTIWEDPADPGGSLVVIGNDMEAGFVGLVKLLTEALLIHEDSLVDGPGILGNALAHLIPYASFSSVPSVISNLPRWPADGTVPVFRLRMRDVCLKG